LGETANPDSPSAGSPVAGSGIRATWTAYSYLAACGYVLNGIDNATTALRRHAIEASWGVEPTLGFEPRTCCLRNSCSTAELCRRGCDSSSPGHAWRIPLPRVVREVSRAFRARRLPIGFFRLNRAQTHLPQTSAIRSSASQDVHDLAGLHPISGCAFAPRARSRTRQIDQAALERGQFRYAGEVFGCHEWAVQCYASFDCMKQHDECRYAFTDHNHGRNVAPRRLEMRSSAGGVSHNAIPAHSVATIEYSPPLAA
jgi:hypothetical protein